MIRAAIYGRTGSDPVPRQTRTGKPMVTTSVAVNVSKHGEEPVTEWFGIVAFGAVGELLARHVKGDLICAMGPLTRSAFVGRDGEERAGWGLVAEAVLSARTVRDERLAASSTRRPRGNRPPSRFYSSPKQSGGSVPDLPADDVADLFVDGLVP
jgi:single-strand DNA-binding protein